MGNPSFDAEKYKAGQIRQRIADAAREYATGDGRIRMANEAICVVGRRPAAPS